jgi:ketosteroid isomerase-like protein
VQAAHSPVGREAFEQEKQQMKALMKTIVVLLGCVSLDPVLAQPPQAPAQAPSVYDTIMQLSHEWGDAEMASDVDKMNQIIADDWTADYPGHFVTKATLLSGVRTGKHKLLSCELGPHEVKAFGDIAVVQGSVTERRLGVDGILHFAYMDVWTKRGGKWLVVRSLWKKI